MGWRKRTSFWLEFDPETLELVNLTPLGPKGSAPSVRPEKFPTLVRVIKAKDEASVRRDYDFKCVALVLQAERVARRGLFEEVIDRLPDPQERRAMQLLYSYEGPKRTIDEAAAEMGYEVGLVCTGLSRLYAGVARRWWERNKRI